MTRHDVLNPGVLSESLNERHKVGLLAKWKAFDVDVDTICSVLLDQLTEGICQVVALGGVAQNSDLRALAEPADTDVDLHLDL